ncbi:MAG: hypothetical protein L6U99_14990 [Clostridium sp.]|nr:MAG: hypothetical protein L6U99_14990 [Clostridium sp.]
MLINHFLDNSVACGNIGYPFGLAMLEEYDFFMYVNCLALCLKDVNTLSQKLLY